jgi:hypothetical protein
MFRNIGTAIIMAAHVKYAHVSVSFCNRSASRLRRNKVKNLSLYVRFFLIIVIQ